MALGIVSGSEVNTPSSGVQINSAAFRNAALAPGRVAQALGEQAAAIGDNVGGLFRDVSQKIQDNQNARRIFDADLAMRKTKDNFTAQLAKMPDEGTWLPAYKAQVDALRQQTMDNPHIGPDVRRVLNQKFDVWEAATTAEVRTAALLKGAKETRESAIADATYAAHSGDIEGAMTTLRAAVDNHAMSPGDVKKISSRFPSIAAQAQAETAIATNPIKAPDLIKKFEGVIEPRVYVGVMAHAYEMRNKTQGDNLNNFAQDLDNSPDGTIDPKLLQQAVKDGQITQRGMNGLLDRIKKKGVETAKDQFNVLMADADDQTWTDNKAPEATVHDMKQDGANLPEPLRRRFYNHLDKLMADAKAKGARDEKPVEKDTFDMGKQLFEQGLFRPATKEDVVEKVPHWFKADDTKVVGTTTKPPQVNKGWELEATPAERATTTMNYARWKDDMRQYFKDNPEATNAEAIAHSQSLLAPHVENQVKASIAPKQTKPAGAAFYSPSTGKWYDKDKNEVK